MAVPLANPHHLSESAIEGFPAIRRMAARVLALWHLASLDAPAVAVVWALAFAWAIGVRLESWVPLLLACGTFTVYVGDRLLDAHRAHCSGDDSALRERHHFHWRHRRSLIPAACAAAAIAVALIMDRMPPVVRDRNSILAAAALVYFSGVHSTIRLPIVLRRLESRKLMACKRILRKVMSKEFLVGLLFTSGTIAPAIAGIHLARWPFCVCFAIFAALAWLNCSAIESWESSGRPSRVRQHSIALGVFGIVVAGAFAFFDWRLSALTCSAAISALLLSVLDRKRAALSPLTLRALADFVLLTPLLAVLVGASLA